MDLSTLSETYRGFYAPDYSIRVRSDDLMRDLAVAVSQIEVDLQLGTASRFAFTIPDAYSHEHASFLTGKGADLLNVLELGAEISISMGYAGDNSSSRLALSGVVVAISTNFPETGSPELVVEGCDHGFVMTLGKRSRTFGSRPDSDIANAIASFNNLASVIDRTTEKHPRIEQNELSDWEFLKKLAERNKDFDIYVDDQKRLHFAKRKEDSAPVVKLVYGSGLLTFKPEANLAGQVASVEVRGWNPNGKAAFVGIATAGAESGPRGKSGGQFLNSLVRDPDKRPTLRIRQPVFTQAEADQRAKAALEENARKFVTGEGEAIGLPELVPDRTVELANLGTKFSQIYYIQQATHRIDSNGYRTRFKVKVPKVKAS